MLRKLELVQSDSFERQHYIFRCFYAALTGSCDILQKSLNVLLLDSNFLGTAMSTFICPLTFFAVVDAALLHPNALGHLNNYHFVKKEVKVSDRTCPFVGIKIMPALLGF